MVKYILSIFLFAIICQFSFTQNDKKKKTFDDCVSIIAIESMPIFDGDLYAFIKKNMVYPKKALDEKVEGRVLVSFWVDSTGKTIDHEIVKGVRDDLNQEALRIVRLLVFSKPGMQNGKPVKVKYTIKVEFKLPIKKHSK
jgi:TonB family protein